MSRAAWSVPSMPGIGGVVLRAGGLEPVTARSRVDSEEGLERELRVVRLHDLGPVHVLHLKRGLEGVVGPEIEGTLGVCHRYRWEKRDLLGQFECTGACVVDQLVHEPELKGDLWGHDASP